MKPDKLSRLLQSADKGRAFAALWENSEVREFFEKAERAFIEEMSGQALTMTPDELRAHAVALDTTRKLRDFIKAGAAAGKRSENEYAKRTGATPDA